MNAWVTVVKVMICCVCVFGLKIPIFSVLNKKIKKDCSVSNYRLLNELAGNLNSKEYFDKYKKEHWIRTAKTYSFFLRFFISQKIEIQIFIKLLSQLLI